MWICHETRKKMQIRKDLGNYREYNIFSSFGSRANLTLLSSIYFCRRLIVSHNLFPPNWFDNDFFPQIFLGYFEKVVALEWAGTRLSEIEKLFVEWRLQCYCILQASKRFTVSTYSPSTDKGFYYYLEFARHQNSFITIVYLPVTNKGLQSSWFRQTPIKSLCRSIRCMVARLLRGMQSSILCTPQR